jgi:tRNA(fMet)-specific endonuclease VapC
MILLDTDHFSTLKYRESPRCRALRDRMDATGWKEFAITIVSVEEQMRGWLTEVGRLRKVRDQVWAYEELGKFVQSLRDWEIVEFNERAVDIVEGVRRQEVRVGIMDLKIASTALANDALLLSANHRDFGKVPGLRVEDWLRP